MGDAKRMVRTRRGRLLAAMLACCLGGCHQRTDTGPVIVSAIGKAPTLSDPARGALGNSSRILMGAVAQGLVRLDASGNVEPGIAERWIVIDDGGSYIFRIGDVAWPDGEPVTARDVVRILNRQRDAFAQRVETRAAKAAAAFEERKAREDED